MNRKVCGSDHGLCDITDLSGETEKTQNTR
jgi:hypothetical protein